MEERLASLGGEGGGGAGEGGEEGDELSSRLMRATNALQEVQRAASSGLQLTAPTPDAVRHQLRRCLVSNNMS